MIGRIAHALGVIASMVALFIATGAPVYPPSTDTPTEDGVMVGSGSKWNTKVLPSCSNASSDKLLYNSSTNTFSCGTDQTSAGTGYTTIQDETTPLTARSTVNFTGSGVTCVDNSGSARTDCTITSGSGTPAGSDTQVQFNNAGAFGGAANATYNSTEKMLSVSRPVTAPVAKGNTGATPAPDMRDGARQTWTLSANATYTEPANKISGDVLELKTCQDGTGSRTLAFWTVTWQGGSPVMPTTATTGCLTTFTKYNGTTWEGTWISTADPGWPNLASDDAVPVGDGTNFVAKVIPDCDDTAGNHLNYDTATNAFSCGTSTSGITTSSSSTLTNKTIDAEGTGNVITIPVKVWLPAAACDGSTASPLWDLPASNPAVAACVTGTNTQKGVLSFADGANSLSAQMTLMLPEDWTGALDAKIKWYSSTTSGDVVWQIATICVADAETDDPAFNAASTVTDTTKGTTNQTNDATISISSVTTTGCAAGELMHLKIFRDPTHGSDTMGGTAQLIGVQLTLRRAM